MASRRGGHLLRVVRTRYLSELIVAGVTFDEQVQALKVWAGPAFADIMNNVEAPTRSLDQPDNASGP